MTAVSNAEFPAVFAVGAAAGLASAESLTTLLVFSVWARFSAGVCIFLFWVRLPAPLDFNTTTKSAQARRNRTRKDIDLFNNIGTPPVRCLMIPQVYIQLNKLTV
jgi:hypothetical protein